MFSILLKYPELPLLFLMACTRAIQKVPSGEQLTKQAMRKKCYIQKTTYILKLLLNVVTAGIEALVYRGISFCIPVLKKSAACEFSHVLTPSINSSLLLKLCDPHKFFR
jgi:hypothetical protein